MYVRVYKYTSISSYARVYIYLATYVPVRVGRYLTLFLFKKGNSEGIY